MPSTASTKIIRAEPLRRLALELAARNRAHTFTQVSKDFIDEAETHIRLWALTRIASLPSAGKTIR